MVSYISYLNPSQLVLLTLLVNTHHNVIRSHGRGHPLSRPPGQPDCHLEVPYLNFLAMAAYFATLPCNLEGFAVLFR